MLFFGARTQEELPLLRPAAEPAEGLHRHQPRVLAHAGQPKRYVQDLMRERAADLGAAAAGRRTPALLRVRPEERWKKASCWLRDGVAQQAGLQLGQLGRRAAARRPPALPRPAERREASAIAAAGQANWQATHLHEIHVCTVARAILRVSSMNDSLEPTAARRCSARRHLARPAQRQRLARRARLAGFRDPRASIGWRAASGICDLPARGTARCSGEVAIRRLLLTGARWPPRARGGRGGRRCTDRSARDAATSGLSAKLSEAHLLASGFDPSVAAQRCTASGRRTAPPPMVMPLIQGVTWKTALLSLGAGAAGRLGC